MEEQIETTIGQFFKEARESRGLELAMLSKKTRIHVSIYEQLENDDLNALPNRVYVNGYVKSISKELGLDQEEALRILDHTYEIVNNPSAKPHEESSTPTTAEAFAKETIDEKIKKLPVKTIAASTIAILFILLAYKYSSTAKNDIKVEEVQEPAPISATTVNAHTPLVDEKAEIVKVEEPVPEPKAPAVAEVPVEVVKKNKDDVDNKYELNRPVTFRDITGPLFTTRDASLDEIKLIPEGIEKQMISGNQNLLIVANNADSWITFKRDNEPLQKLTIKKGKHLVLSAKEIRIFFGNIKSSTLFLNGLAVDAPSPSSVKTIVFPAESGKKFKMPLFVYLKNGMTMTSEDYLKATKNSN